MDSVQAPSPHLNRRYILRSQIGQGGMGIVYRATDRLTQETVALKQVSIPANHLQFSTSGGDPTLALALEFRTLAGLRHPHIVAVLDYGFDTQKRPYYTMQLIENAQSLTDYGQTLDEGGKIRLIIEMLHALVYLHRRGVIHRDLKPANVLVTAARSVKVMDFGLSVQHEASVHVATGVAGTLQYMAPELFSETPASVASDLYAVGVIVYELFVGQPPFASKNLAALITTILTRDPDLTPLPSHLIPVIEQLLAKIPDERYASAEDVIQALCVATNTPLPAESLLLRESFLQASTFVGRDTELTTLKDALEAVFAGQGSVWLIGGESGVGKSRLLDELRSRTLVRGALVLRGQAVAEGGLPYQLWRDVIRRLALETEVSDLEAGIFKPLVPDIETLLERDIPDVADLPGEAGQQRLILTLMDVLKRQTQPLVLLLEDLQWAEESLAPLRQILLVQEQLPHLLVIGTFRDDERPSLPDDLIGAQVLKLPRLNEAAIAQLAQSMLGEAGTQAAVVEMLQRETEGNVFFMVETVRALAEDAGTLTAVGQTTLPYAIFAGGVQRVVQRRLNRLPEMWRPLLQRAAVAGRALDLTVLGHLAEGLDIETFLAAGLDASLFEVTDERWRFSHDKLREGVLAALSEDDRRTLNRDVALALEASYPDDPNYHEGLMGYWQAAGDIERELRYLLPVMQHMTKIRADYDDAIHLGVHGLTLLNETDVRQVLLLTLSSEAHAQLGHIAEAQELGQRALVLAHELGDQRGIANSLSRLGVSALSQGDYAIAQTYHQQSLALFRGLGDKQGIANSLDALSRSVVEQNVLAGHDYAKQSLALFRELGDKRGIANSLHLLGHIALTRSDSAAVRDYAQQSLALFDEIGDKQGIGEVLNRLGSTLCWQGDYAAAHDCFQQSLTLYRRIGNKPGIAQSLNGLGYLMWSQGDYAAAHMYHQQSLALRRELEDKQGTVWGLTGLGYLMWSEGDYAGASDHFQQSLTLAREIGNRWNVADSLCAMAALQLDQGMTDVASLLREGLEVSLDIHVAESLLIPLTVVARWYTRMGRSGLAAELTGLVDAHPATDLDIRKRGLNTLIRELQAAMPADELLAAMEGGKTLDLETTVRDLLAQSWEQ